jgi:Flp pilus assembly protein TadD
VCGLSVRTLTPAVYLLTVAVCGAQRGPQLPDNHSQVNQVSVHGEVTVDGGRLDENDLSVELVSQDHRFVSRTQVALSGDFDLQNVEPGDYQLRVLDSGRQVIQTEYVAVSETENTFSIRLPERKQAERPATGVVSLSQLKRKIPPKALKEFNKSVSAHQAGDDQKSIEHLNKALELYPDFAEAQSNLGIRYLKLQQYQVATRHFRKAVELLPTCGPAFTNLSVGLFEMDQYPEAQAAARQALKLDGTDDKARMILGLSLAAAGTNPDEALKDLRGVETRFPRVRLAIADLLVQRGDPHDAAAELKQYLTAGDVHNRDQVETWIARIEQGLPPR